MAGYTRQSTFTDGDIINAADSNDEFNQLVNAFGNTTGHSHDGTAGEGPVIGLIGDPGVATPINKVVVDDTNNQIEFNIDVSGTSTEQFVVKDGVIEPTTDDDIDLGSASKQFKDLYIDGTANIDSLVADTADINGGTIDGVTINTTSLTATTADINGGTIDGTVIGGTTAAAGDFTTVNSSGAMIATGGLQGVLTGSVLGNSTATSGTSTFNNVTASATVQYGSLSDGTITITGFVDEDNMSSDSATLVPTQQSVKAYVDTQLTAEDLDVSADTGTIDIDLDSETLTIAGGTGLDSSATGTTVTIGIDSTVATLTGSQTLTNKTLTSAVLNTGVSGTAVLDEDNMASDSATQLATQQSIKAYVDNEISGAGVPSDTDGLSEGSTNLYFTNTRADARITNAVGTSVQAYDAGLTSIAGLTTAADKIIYTSASDTYAVTDFTAFGRSLVDDADASAGRTTLGLGTAATQDVGTTANDVVQLDGAAKLPAIDGSQLTNLPSSGISDVVDDTTPQLGGNLDVNTNNITFGDSATPGTDDTLIFGAGNDLQIYHDGTRNILQNGSGINMRVNAPVFQVRTQNGNTNQIQATDGGAVDLYHNGVNKISTSSTGVTVTGTVAATAVTGDGSGLTNLPAAGDGGIAMAIALG